MPIRTPTDRPLSDDAHHERLDALEDAEQDIYRRRVITAAQARHLYAPPAQCEARWTYLFVGVVMGVLGSLLAVTGGTP